MLGRQVLCTWSRVVLRMHPRTCCQGAQPSQLSLSPLLARGCTQTAGVRCWQQTDCQLSKRAAARCRTAGQLCQPQPLQRQLLGTKRSLLHTSVLCCAASKEVTAEGLVRRITRGRFLLVVAVHARVHALASGAGPTPRLQRTSHL